MFKEDYIMKRFPKLIVTLLLLAMVVGIFAAIPVAAATEYEEFIKIKARNVEAGHYTNTACTGELVQHSANTNYREEVGCMVDNDNKGGYWNARRGRSGFGGFSGGFSERARRTNNNPNEGDVKIITTSEQPQKRVNDNVGDYVDFEEVKSDK
jgi:hypothetical protein